MDSPIQSSFIPHDATKISNGYSPARSSGGAGELLLLVSIVFLVASGALAGGVFLYKQYLEAARTQKVNDLTRAKAQFEPSLIDQLTQLDARMRAAQDILASHQAPSVIFQALESSTLSTMSFDGIDYTAADPQHIKIHMRGTAQSVNSIALQAETFSKSAVITDPIFSSISREADGVHFDFTATINPAALNYSSLANGAAAAQTTSMQPQTPSTIFNTGNNTSQQSASAPQSSSGQSSGSGVTGQ